MQLHSRTARLPCLLDKLDTFVQVLNVFHHLLLRVNIVETEILHAVDHVALCRGAPIDNVRDVVRAEGIAVQRCTYRFANTVS